VNKSALALIGILFAAGAVAHDSPGDVIHALTHRMELEGTTARLL